MLEDIRRLLLDAVVLEGVRQAWLESQPGPAGGHEEGGFIVQDYDRSYAVIRWPHGTADEILVPAHDGCEAQGKPIWLTFHTHPNTGSDFMQEPSEDDEIAVRDDRDLKNLCKNLLLLAIKAYGTLLPERLKRCTMEASRTSLALA